MALDPLASTTDLSARGIATSGAATDLLDAASAAIRAAAGSAISKLTSTITLAGTADPWLAVPLDAVRTVTDVSIDGAAVTGPILVDGRLWNDSGWRTSRRPSLVTLTVDHGYDPVPADIVDLCCSLVAAGLASVEDGYDPLRGVTMLSIDDYQESFSQSASEVVNPLELPARTRSWLRQRFGGGTYVVGSY